MSDCLILEGFEEVRTEPTARPAPRVRAAGVPAELQEAEALLVRYGQWAQDRYQKRRCASAEGKYVPPPTRDEEAMPSFMPDWNALQVQHALVVVPMQFRRVLQAFYIPQRRHHHSVRRELQVSASAWEDRRIEGLRQFASIYRLRYR